MSYDAFQSRTADLKSRKIRLHLNIVVQWRLKNFLIDLTSDLDLKSSCLIREDRLRSLRIKFALAVQILAYLTNWDMKTPYTGVPGMLLSMKGKLTIQKKIQNRPTKEKARSHVWVLMFPTWTIAALQGNMTCLLTWSTKRICFLR